MTSPELINIVRSVLCKGLTPDEAEEIVQATSLVTVSPRGLVFREGDEAAGLLLFLAGTVEIVKQGREGPGQTIAIVEAPSVLGEMSLVTYRRHSATVRAQTECQFRLLRRADFVRLIDADSLGAYKLLATIAEVLAHRLYRMDDKVVELSAQHECAQPVEELAAFKEKLFSEWRS